MLPQRNSQLPRRVVQADPRSPPASRRGSAREAHPVYGSSQEQGCHHPEKLIATLFPILLITGSKQLRTQIYSNIVTIVKGANTGSKAQKLNKSVQALLFNVLSTGESSGLWATKLTRELWRRGIWDDSRTVEIMAQATLHGEAKIAISGVRFFLGADKEREEANAEDSDSDASAEIGALKHRLQINKNSRKRGRKAESAMNKLLKKRKGNGGVSATYLNFSALHLLRDPRVLPTSSLQTYASIDTILSRKFRS